MGKYMRKAKISAEVSIMDPSPLGVRTRAKTLALQRLQKSPVPEDSSLYLQLRSRRLEKHFASPAVAAKARSTVKSSFRPRNPGFNPSPKVSTNNTLDGSPANSRSAASPMRSCCSRKQNGLEVPPAARIVSEVLPGNDAGIEVSLGENVPDYETIRKSRETTPCSLIRNSETIGTPGSTTRQTTSAANTRRMRPSATCDIPTAQDMDAFFAGPEQAQQRRFSQKYNFDPVNEQPLPGRYEWEKLDV